MLCVVFECWVFWGVYNSIGSPTGQIGRFRLMGTSSVWLIRFINELCQMNHSDSSTKWVTQIAHSMTCLFYYTNITGAIASV